MRAIFVLSLLLLPFSLRGETAKLPPEKDLRALTLDTLLAFNKAVQEKSFASFYKDQTSSLLREQVSADKFSEAFRSFVEKGFDIGGISKVEAVFDEKPAIDGDGVLILKGSFPAQPNKVAFRLRYLYEKPAWKLLGINVETMPSGAETAKLPADKELKALVRESLLAFNKAVQGKSFEDFYPEIATVWQDQITPEKLQEIFQSFIDQEIDIGPVAKLQPSFEEKPAINSDGILVVKGTYQTKPSRLSFQLKYIYEDPEWKLVGINVDVKKSPVAAPKADENEKEGN